jgi:hypothetical protein
MVHMIIMLSDACAFSSSYLNVIDSRYFCNVTNLSSIIEHDEMFTLKGCIHMNGLMHCSFLYMTVTNSEQKVANSILLVRAVRLFLL